MKPICQRKCTSHGKWSLFKWFLNWFPCFCPCLPTVHSHHWFYSSSFKGSVRWCHVSAQISLMAHHFRVKVYVITMTFKNLAVPFDIISYFVLLTFLQLYWVWANHSQSCLKSFILAVPNVWRTFPARLSEISDNQIKTCNSWVSLCSIDLLPIYFSPLYLLPSDIIYDLHLWLSLQL